MDTPGDDSEVIIGDGPENVDYTEYTESFDDWKKGGSHHSILYPEGTFMALVSDTSSRILQS